MILIITITIDQSSHSILKPTLFSFKKFSPSQLSTPGWLKKTRWDNQLLFHFWNFYVEKMILAKAVAYTIVFNTASTITNLFLNSQDRLLSCSGIGLLIEFLVFYHIKMTFVKPEACAIIFSTASPVFKFMK